MHNALGSTADEPADATVVITAHDQYVDIIVIHEHRQGLCRVAYAHMAVFDGDAVAFGKLLEGSALSVMQGLGIV